ncbi:MAG: LOG family protein [Tenericutes bacterium]|nr:LOG family protein [Mycoplasmatota bacterium]
MNVAILSSSSREINPYYVSVARSIAKDLASKEFDLVFGGCSTSMMGVCYQEFVDKGRNIYSFTTERYTDDIKNLPNAKHYIRETTFDLKKSLFENSDLIIALAGGVGTLSEVLSFVEENRSNDKNVPIVIYDENHYYDFLFKQLNFMQDECFLNDDITKWLTIIHNHNEWVNYMENFINEKGKMIK